MKINRFKGVETYLFDLGGVIVDIDPRRTISEFQKLGFSGVEEQISQCHHEGLFKALERGEIEASEFIEGIKGKIEQPVSDQDILMAWNSILVDLPVERVKILEVLNKQFPTYLLSNTNGIHHKTFTKMATGHDQIEELFNDVFYSYRLGYSKPEKEVYEKVIEESGLNPSTTLFLDDSEINLNAASEFGFKTALVSASNTLEKIFGDLIK